jgi:hypothetical protein
MTPYSPTRTVTAVVQKGAWNGEAWEAAHMTPYSPTRTITAVVKKGEWDSEAWKAVNINSGSKTVSVGVKLTEDNTNTTGFNLWDWWKNTFVKNTKFEIDTLVNLVQNGWTSVEGYVDNNFGGGNGGGGQTAGGGGGRYDVNIGLRRYDGWGDDSWTTVSGWVSQFSGDAIVEQVVGLVSSGWNYVVDWVNGRVGGNATTGVELTNKGTNWSKGIVNFITGGLGYVSLAIQFATTTGNVVTSIASALKKALGIKAAGGVFSNGVWSNIPQYAGGTTNAHGSLFLAGEAGPEIVGHVGGRTEILNKSQLAAAMYSAVHSAMAGVTLDADFRGYGAGHTDEGEYETMYQVMYEAFTAALARGEAMDREKVDLLRQINEKDFTAEVSTAEINNAQRRMNRRAGTTIVPVGT